MSYPIYYPQGYPAQQPMQQPIQQPIQQPAIQNGGYVIVQSEDEIKRYPVAHGNIVTFRIENQPIVVEKSMGFSQFDTPHYERYRLIKEDSSVPEEVKVEYALKSDIDALATNLAGQIETLKNDIASLNEKKTTARKKEAE